MSPSSFSLRTSALKDAVSRSRLGARSAEPVAGWAAISSSVVRVRGPASAGRPDTAVHQDVCLRELEMILAS